MKKNLRYLLLASIVMYKYIIFILSIPRVTSDAMSTPTEPAKDGDVSESM